MHSIFAQSAKPQAVDLGSDLQGASISVKNLTFQYDQFTAPVFSDLNVEIQAGESVAISAKSGFGKTTLLKLMAGLLKPTKGEIYFNNLDIKQLGMSNYRQHIACVLQDDKFFAGSILENIVSFETKYDREFAIECARQAQIHDEIMAMPMNYETLLGEQGNNLSGGHVSGYLLREPCTKNRKSCLWTKPLAIWMKKTNKKLMKRLGNWRLRG